MSLALVCAVILGPTLGFVGLYRLLTSARRCTMRQIREGAAARGWRFAVRRWFGDPTAFRLDSDAGWRLTTSGTTGYDPGWTVRMTLVFAALGGRPDVVIEPRTGGGAGQAAGPVGDTLAQLLGLGAEANDRPTGAGAFDARYRVTGPPLDPALAARFVDWPADTVAPHSMLAWRDRHGFHLQIRLPGPPNWATIAHAVDLAEAIARLLPPAQPAPEPEGLTNRLVAALTGV